MIRLLIVCDQVYIGGLNESVRTNLERKMFILYCTETIFGHVLVIQIYRTIFETNLNGLENMAHPSELTNLLAVRNKFMMAVQLLHVILHQYIVVQSKLREIITVGWRVFI